MSAAPTTSRQTEPADGVLIFDGECGFCTWAADWARRRLPRGVLVVPYQMVEDLSAYGLTQKQAESAVYWIDREGRPNRAHRAVAEALRDMGGRWRAVGTAMLVPPLRQVAAGAYEVVASNRRRLPGSTPACSRPAWLNR